MFKLLLVVLFIVFGLFLYWMVFLSVEEAECVLDSDCVEAECCHPVSCVNIDEKMDCSDIFCTAVCLEGTLDCGQGSCGCIEGNCNAVFRN
jgi:hypothetical protein